MCGKQNFKIYLTLRNLIKNVVLTFKEKVKNDNNITNDIFNVIKHG